MYITAASTISHQNTFGKSNFLDALEPLAETHQLINPDYKEYMPAIQLRRMSKVLKMAIACSKNCIQQKDEIPPEAIIVGTGLGCLTDTEKFIRNIIHAEEGGLIPPTAFIHSTHNTIAGQISIHLKNHGYNTTYTQNELSFEQALLDAELHLLEGKQNILIGAADEHISFLNEIATKISSKIDKEKLTSGASFFMFSNQPSQDSTKILATQTYSNNLPIEENMKSFITKSGINETQVDLILSATPIESKTSQITYTAYSGLHQSSSAFALHMAHQYILNKQKNIVLIVNNLSNKLGLTLLKRI